MDFYKAGGKKTCWLWDMRKEFFASFKVWSLTCFGNYGLVLGEISQQETVEL